MTSHLSTISAALGTGPDALRETRTGEMDLEASPSALPALADRVMLDLKGRLLSLFATDERDTTGQFVLHYL